MATKELRPEDVTAVIDNREQLPHDLRPLQSVPGTLQSGDYSVLGLEAFVAIERKSLADFVMCCGVERDRFERELDRLRAYPHRAVVIEASMDDLHAGLWRSKMSPASVVASFEAWTIRYAIPFVLAGDRALAARTVANMLFYAARDRWNELLAFEPTLRIAR